MAVAHPVEQKSAFFIKSRGLLLFLVFIVIFGLFILASIRYSNGTHFSNSGGNTLAIIGAPGQQVFVTINAGKSLSGYVATPSGLTLTLNTPSGFSTLLIAPKERYWPSRISVSTKDSDPSDFMLLTGSFVIPSDVKVGAQPISGQVSGMIEYPAGRGIFFANKTKQLSIPVQLSVISPSEVFMTVHLPLYAVAGLGVVVLLALPGLFRLYDVRRLGK